MQEIIAFFLVETAGEVRPQGRTLSLSASPWRAGKKPIFGKGKGVSFALEANKEEEFARY